MELRVAQNQILADKHVISTVSLNQAALPETPVHLPYITTIIQMYIYLTYEGWK